jgi:hypothetical protein
VAIARSGDIVHDHIESALQRCYNARRWIVDCFRLNLKSYRSVKAVTGAKRYRVELNTSPFFDGQAIFAASAFDNQRTFPVYGASPQTEYFARVTTDLNNGHGKITSFITAPAAESSMASTEESREGISIWPNPSYDKFDIAGTDEQQNLSIEVVDFSGAVIYRSDFKGAHSFGDDLPKGMYVVRIFDGFIREERRLLKK